MILSSFFLRLRIACASLSNLPGMAQCFCPCTAPSVSCPNTQHSLLLGPLPLHLSNTSKLNRTRASTQLALLGFLPCS